jgi:hypothetical protein
MNVRHGVFQVEYIDPEKKFKIIQSIYAHRFYNRAIVNQINVYRLTNDSGEFGKVQTCHNTILFQEWYTYHCKIVFTESITIDLHQPIKHLEKHGHNHRNPYNNDINRNDDDIIFTTTKTILLDNKKIRVNCGFTRYRHSLFCVFFFRFL